MWTDSCGKLALLWPQSVSPKLRPMKLRPTDVTDGYIRYKKNYKNTCDILYKYERKLLKRIYLGVLYSEYGGEMRNRRG